VIKKILDYPGIYEFKRDRPPLKILSIAYTFDDCRCDNYIDTEYVRFLRNIGFLKL